MNNEEAFALNEKQLPLPASSLPHDRSLYPAHFRAITEPGCDDVNGSYYSCVAFNNRFSKVDPAKATCPEKGEGCKWGSHKWLE